MTTGDLPPCVYEKRGVFYLVKRQRWHRLGRDRAAAIEAAARFVPPEVMERDEIEKHAYRVITTARQNAKGRRKLEFSLTREDALPLLEKCNWRCAVTGTPFSLQMVGSRRSRPYAPSLDRIDCDIGYVATNCRFVCVAANFAMNRWGEGVLYVLAKNMRNLRQR